MEHFGTKTEASFFFTVANKKVFQIVSVVTISDELLHWDEGKVMHPSLVCKEYKENCVVFSSL